MEQLILNGNNMIIVYLYIAFSVLYIIGVLTELDTPIWMFPLVLPFSPIILPIRLGAQNEQARNK